jgi:hypothetical protein
MPRCNNAAQSIATLAPTISNLMKKPLPPCLRCGTPVKEARRKYCSPKCAGNGHGPSPEQLAAKARKRAQTKRVFLKALGEHGTAAAACRIARIDRRTVHVWKKEDEKFAEAWAEATEVACDVVEQSLVDRAVHGVAEPIFYKGRQVGERREYDTQAGMFFLKGRRAHVFGDRVVATHQGPEGVPLVPSLTAVQIVVRDPATIAAIEQGRCCPRRSRIRRRSTRRCARSSALTGASGDLHHPRWRASLRRNPTHIPVVVAAMRLRAGS